MTERSNQLVVALAGNPNSGKTTVFNNLTGHRQKVGNYPGVTVEKKEGICRFSDASITVVDLPGTYSLTAYSIEEIVARDFILNEHPDVVVDIIDASNLERNLYLATQLLDLKVPTILAFNMSDIAKARGMEFDLDHLSWLLGAPIISLVGSRNIGTDELLRTIISYSKSIDNSTPNRSTQVNYGREIEEEITKIQDYLSSTHSLPDGYDIRWTSIKLLEDDTLVRDQIQSPEVLEVVQQSIDHLRRIFGDAPEIIMADRRYGYISGACQEAVKVSVESRHNMSDSVDSVVTNRVLGLPIFLVLMYIVFQLTFSVAAVPMGWLEAGFIWASRAIGSVWPEGTLLELKSLLVDGIIGGVGGVVVFLPNILFLFLAIAIMEDTGYMARAAFIMDRLMHKIGLHGKSFIPLMIGFGCTVPAIMATRILENKRDRLTTMLVAPLMSCSARLPIYALIIPAFFVRSWRGPILLLIYLTGVVLAILVARLLRITLLRGETTPLVMELPPYRLPTVRGVIIHMWERGFEYIKKAGTVILALSIVLWALTRYPQKEEMDPDLITQVNSSYRNAVMGIDSVITVLEAGTDSDLFKRILLSDLAETDQEFVVRAEIQDRDDTIMRFRGILESIRDARKTFDSMIMEGEIRHETPEYAILRGELFNRLARLERDHGLLFRTALHYEDTVYTQYRDNLERLEAQHASRRLAHSIAGRIGNALEPVLRPMGFDWRIGTALIGAFAAKEVFVAQMGIVFAVGDDDEADVLRLRLRKAYTPLTAFCIMLFTLISIPCVATIAVTIKESRSWRWAALQLVGLTMIAYMITTFVYQIGSLLGIGTGTNHLV